MTPIKRRLDMQRILVHVVCGALILSCILGVLLLLWQSLRFRSKFSDAHELRRGPARQALDGLLKRNRIRRRIQLLSSDRHVEPIAYGLHQWTIVLPERIESRLRREELQALLAHEVAHLVRGDVVWLWVGRVLCTCVVFQPLNLIARRRWQQASEYLCDDWAVACGIPSLSLAQCLTQVAEWRLTTRPCVGGLAAGGTKATLVQRVERLIDERPDPDRWATSLRRTMVNLVAVLCIPLLVGFIPRVALPLVAEHSAGVFKTSEHSSPVSAWSGPLSRLEWLRLHEQLMQLDADVERANQLLEGTPRLDGAEPLLNDIRRRAAMLRARRERIASSFGKESG